MAVKTHPEGKIPSKDAIQGITIALDTYDDIFSDFDPREYESRALSDDFLAELSKIVREDDEKKDLQEFHLLIPAGLRNEHSEEIISHRLHNYFRKIQQKLREEVRITKRKGVLLLLSGLMCLLLAGFISFLHTSLLGLHLIMVALEPAGWFFIWMAYDNLFGSVLRKKSDLEFHSRMTKRKIAFKTLGFT